MKFKTILLIGYFALFSLSSKNKTKVKKPLVTFIELGSVRCIPCQKMQVVMKSV
jgi:hypothetical protein